MVLELYSSERHGLSFIRLDDFSLEILLALRTEWNAKIPTVGIKLCTNDWGDLGR